MKPTDIQNRLYLSPDTTFSIDNAESAAEALLSRADSRSAKLVLFIHGRGAGRIKHPQKALEQMLPALEAEYGVNVLLFNWAGSGEGGALSGFPENNARRAAKDLHTVITALHRTIEKTPHSVELAVLTHSMGSLVLEETLLQYATDLPLHFAHSIIISAPASAATEHNEWLDSSTLAMTHYVITNHRDKALWWVEKWIGKKERLGRNLYGSTLALNTHYIDLSNAGVNHRYFFAQNSNNRKTGQNGNPCLGQFYRHALRNEIIDAASLFDTDDTVLKKGYQYAIKTDLTATCD